MASQPSLKKNFILSTMYQLLTIIAPIITAPYISRVLGSAGVGIYSFTYSIETYFSMFAALGTVSYGAREIARNRNDRDKYSKLFWEIEGLTIFTTIICMIGWGVVIMMNNEYRIYYIILTIFLLSTMFDISWFYTGMEQFKYTVTQNAIFKILGIVALFVFVKTKEDVAIYTAVMALTTFLGHLGMWIYLPKFIKKVPLKSINIWPHFKETLIYFIPTIATSIYTVLDKTLIGAITHDDNENGYYEQATKIMHIAKSLTFTSLNSVLGSRISYLYAEKKYDEIKNRISFSLDYILFMGIGICFGLIGVAKCFVPVFFGPGYDEVIFLLQLLSPVVIIIGISNCLGSQYYNPAGLRLKSAKYIIAGSVTNLIFNIIFIPMYKSDGAVIATLIAESVITILYMCNCGDVASWKLLFGKLYKKLIAGVAMLAVVLLMTVNLPFKVIYLLLEIAAGGLVYLILLIAFKDSFVISFWNNYIKKKVKRHG